MDKARLLMLSQRTVSAWKCLQQSYDIVATCYGIDHPFTRARFIMLQNVAGRLDEPYTMGRFIDSLYGPYMLPEGNNAPRRWAEKYKTYREWFERTREGVKKTPVHDYPWHGIPFMA